MLTVFALTHAKQAAKYYEQDNYYHRGSAESIAATHWWGKGAELLGLSDYVDPERFVELLQGKINAQTILGRIRHDEGVAHKPGYDLTFSAPKSVSMLAEIGQDFRIYDAHNRAVNAALTYFQKHASFYRQTKNAHTEVCRGDNLMVAKFRHDTSRSVEDTIDCQLHTHCIVLNAIQGKDGQWRSLFEKPFFDLKMLGGVIYRSALASELKKLGYQIDKTREDGLFEISGFTRDHIEAFSKRRIKILDVMKELGLFGAQAAQAVTLGIREHKETIDRQKLQQHWEDRIQALDLDLTSMIQTSKQIAKHSKKQENIDKQPEIVAQKALHYAISHLGERQSVFKKRDLIKTALQYALGEIDVRDIHRTIERFQKDKNIVFLGKQVHDVLYTSPKILAQEKHMLQMMQAGQQECDPIASQEAVLLYLKKQQQQSNQNLTACQTKAIQFLCGNTDRISAIQGYAGTGKTTLLQSVCRLAEQAGYDIRGAAPSASAADVLRTDTGITTETLSGLLFSLRQEKSPKLLTQKPELIILDEASMASTHQMHNLLQEAERLNKRIFLIGDRQQLPAVEHGDPFGLLQDNGLHYAVLKTIVRQKAGDIKFAVEETLNKNIDHAFRALGNPVFKVSDGDAFFSPQSQVVEITDKNERLASIADHYLSLDTQERQDTMILLGSNEDRATVNEMIRQGLIEEGFVKRSKKTYAILQSKGMTATEKTHIFNYEVGDFIRFNKAYRSKNIRRFDYLRVVQIDSVTHELVLDKNGKEIRWQPEKSSIKKGGAVEIFTEEKRALAPGDVIRWTQNNKKLDIYNTEMAEVISVDHDMAQVKLRHGNIITLDLKQSIHQHWDYAWSSTIYAAQGKKAKNVIAQLEGYNAHLTHQRSFYVTLSRAVNRIQLYVDDLGDVIKGVKKYTGDKSNALTFLESYHEEKLFERYLQSAHVKLNEHIHENDNESERLVQLANQYSQYKDREAVHLLATDFKDRQRLNALIREKLKKIGQIDTQEVSLAVLRQSHIRIADERYTLKPGMVIGFERGYKKWRIYKGSYLIVKKVDELQDQVLLTYNNQDITLPLSFLVDHQNKTLTGYRSQTASLVVGDEILWSKSNKLKGIKKDQSATIKKISSDYIVLSSAQKEITLSIHDSALKHWRYAYAKGLYDPMPKRYQVGLAHLDHRIQSPARTRAILGAMGKAKKIAHIYTHSKDYVVNQIQAITHQSIDLKLNPRTEIQKEVYRLLEEFEASRKTVSQAWVTYFERKKAGLETEENLRYALMLDQAHIETHGEMATQIVLDPNFDANEVHALGMNAKRIQKYAQKRKIQLLLTRYQASQGIMRGYLANKIIETVPNLDQALKKDSLEKKEILETRWHHQKRLQQLQLSPKSRRDGRMLERYFQYGQQARQLWKRIYRSREEKHKLDPSQFTFANHVSYLRNALAQEIISHPERFDRHTKKLSTKTRRLIQTHADKFKKQLEKQVKRERILKTQDWRHVVDTEQQHWDQQRHIQWAHQPKKVYWDKNIVLQAVMGQAERIVSQLVSEEKNVRLSKPHKIVWGRKHGSVQLHLSGTKEGVINDYERGIHGDIIHYYAKRRGIDWYDALSELAAEVGLDPGRAGMQSIQISPQEKAKKERAILEEKKRRWAMRQLAQKTWEQSVPIQGTLVEKYLKKHRGMDFSLENIEVRYHPKAPNRIYYKSGKARVGDRRPAMIVSFRDASDELTGIQCTYLDPETANKDKRVKIGKCTVGQVWGSAGIIYRGGQNKVIIAEGCETAASLIPAEPKSSIYITGGNMQNIGGFDFLAQKYQKQELYVAADNDLSFESGSWKATEAGARKLALSRIQPLVTLPETIKNKKTDYNDVLKRYGKQEIIKQFKPRFTINPKQTIDDITKLIPIVSSSKQIQSDDLENHFNQLGEKIQQRILKKTDIEKEYE